MSLLSGIAGGVDCTPQNALKTVSGRFELDSSLYQDRLVSTPNIAGPSSRPFTAHGFQQRAATTETAGSSSSQTPTPFDLSSLRKHLSPPPGAQQHLSPLAQQHRTPAQLSATSPTPGRTSSRWQGDFERSRNSRPSLPDHSTSRTASPWHAEFQQYSPAQGPPAAASSRSYPALSPQPSLAPWQRPFRPMYHPAPYPPQPFDTNYLPPQPFVSSVNPATPQHQLRPSTAPPDHSAATPAQDQALAPLDESQQLLARTARSFLSDLAGSGQGVVGILDENPKLAESKFMALLKGLGSEQVVVQEGDQSGSEEVGRGAELVSRAGTQSDWASEWANDFLGRSDSGPSTTLQTPMASIIGHVPIGMPEQMRGPQPIGEPVQPQVEIADWGQQFQDQEALLMSDQPGHSVDAFTTHRRKSVHFSDASVSVDVGREDGVPATDHDAVRASVSTSIPGAQASWEEDGLHDLNDLHDLADLGDLGDVDAIDDEEQEAFLNFNGQLRQAHSHRLGVGALEGWGSLQDDWEAFQRQSGVAGGTARGLDSLMGMGRGDRQERYLFQARNPYVAAATVAADGQEQAGSESPTLKGVLELEASVQEDPTDHVAWYNLGLKQQENEREDQAILALSKVVQLNPDYRPAYLALAVSYTNEGEYEAANTMLARWIDLPSEIGKGGNVDTQGWVGGADVAQVANIANSVEGEVEAGLGGLESGGWAGGQKMLVQRLVDLARMSPDEVDADIQVALGVLFNSSEDYSKAEDCFLAALSARPDDWLLWNRLGATLANSGRSNEAIRYYHKALSLHPNFVRALFNLGISYINLAQYPLAAQSVLDALRLQHADASEGYSAFGTPATAPGNAVRGVGSDTLWNTLRSACLHMGMHDLVELAGKRDLSGFPANFASGEATGAV